jgi:hypothetical protein
VFDYLVGQWATFTNHTGVSCCFVERHLCLHHRATAILQESASVLPTLALAYSLLAETSWLSIAGSKGFQRIKRLAILGDFANGASSSHALTCAAAYDFGHVWRGYSPLRYAFGRARHLAPSSFVSGSFSKNVTRLAFSFKKRQPAILLSSLALTNLSLEVGVKRGISKMAP